MKQQVYCIYLLSLVAVFAPIHPSSIGSATTLIRFDSEVVATHDDHICAMSCLTGGLGLHNELTVATFDSRFPVTRALDLDGGTLVLNRDLILDQNASVITLGNIIGNNNMLHLSPGCSLVPEDSCPCNPMTVIFTDLTVVLNSDIVVENIHIIFAGKSRVVGNGHTLTLKNATFTCASQATLTLQSITLDGLQKNSLLCADATSVMTLSDTILNLHDDVEFAQGTLKIQRRVELRGNQHEFMYQSPETLMIPEQSSLILSKNVQLHFNPTQSAQSMLIMHPTARFVMHDAVLKAGQYGLRILQGHLVIDGKVSLLALGSTADNGIILGDGLNKKNNVALRWLKGATLLAQQGYIASNDA